jgi:hypothetical protein
MPHAYDSLHIICLEMKRLWSTTSRGSVNSLLQTGGQTRGRMLASMGVWQAVGIDSLKFNPGPPFSTLLHPASVPPLKTAVFYPIGNSTAYDYVSFKSEAE